MEAIPNFIILNRGKLSFEFLHRGIRDFHGAINYVKSLSYGRPSDKNKLELVMIEGKGSCSTKHALLVELAKENGHNDLELVLGIYKMDNDNTRGVEPILAKYGLSYIPEAHCYIRYKKKRYDFTCQESPDNSPFETLIEETTISPHQITNYKEDYHRTFLSIWMKKAKLPGRWNLEKLWTAREECIKELSGIKDYVVVN
ncbi:MAG: hypothetical protein AAF502_23100 [Bacteroidota bacterium]